jgi:putative hemolysin
VELYKSLVNRICSPPVVAEKDQFLIKVAETDDEIQRAQRLRYQVFNIEQGKGLDSANETKLDCDEFDEYCLHLIVKEKETEDIVGTYRVHPGTVASNGLGFYSAREYNIDGLEKIAQNTLEVGRSCVSPDHRNGSVVALLWAGIGEMLKRSGMNYLLGCVSLEETDPAVGWALYEYFSEKNNLCPLLKAEPYDKYILPRPNEKDIRELLDSGRTLIRSIPPLFKGYLRLGVGVCGMPAWDEEFGTIDFLVLLDLSKLPEKYVRHFL